MSFLCHGHHVSRASCVMCIMCHVHQCHGHHVSCASCVMAVMCHVHHVSWPSCVMCIMCHVHHVSCATCVTCIMCHVGSNGGCAMHCPLLRPSGHCHTSHTGSTETERHTLLHLLFHFLSAAQLAAGYTETPCKHTLLAREWHMRCHVWKKC